MFALYSPSTTTNHFILRATARYCAVPRPGTHHRHRTPAIPAASGRPAGTLLSLAPAAPRALRTPRAPDPQDSPIAHRDRYRRAAHAKVAQKPLRGFCTRHAAKASFFQPLQWLAPATAVCVPPTPAPAASCGQLAESHLSPRSIHPRPARPARPVQPAQPTRPARLTHRPRPRRPLSPPRPSPLPLLLPPPHRSPLPQPLPLPLSQPQPAPHPPPCT